MSATYVFRGRGRCLRDKYQITRGVSEYACEDMRFISRTPRQLNGGCTSAAVDSTPVAAYTYRAQPRPSAEGEMHRGVYGSGP